MRVGSFPFGNGIGKPTLMRGHLPLKSSIYNSHQTFKDLGLKHIRLLTNNLTKVIGLQGFGLEISERVPLEIAPYVESKGYLKTKREKLNHVFVRFQQEVLQ